MADYHTRFSVLFDVILPGNVELALSAYDALERELDEQEDVAIGFAVAAERDQPGGTPENTQLWIHDDERGDPEHVVAFVTRCAALFKLSGRWGFAFAFTCSKSRLDGFGGGAALVDLASGQVRWTGLDQWLDDEFSTPGQTTIAEVVALARDLVAVLKEPAQPMGISEHDFRRWLPRAQAVIARAEATLGPSVPSAVGPAAR